jgi:hypothetical protein
MVDTTWDALLMERDTRPFWMRRYEQPLALAMVIQLKGNAVW